MRHHTGHRARRIFTMLGLVILVTALVAIFCFRLDFLPRPTGPHHIGTTVFTVVDENRPEIFTSGDHPRTLTVQVWYPTTAIQGPTEPYVRDAKAFAGILDAVRLPHATLGYLSLAQTHALTDAPIAEGSFPVVFVLTGNLGYRQSNTVQVEELVSRGFAVIGIDQPGTVSSALLEDGRRIPYGGSTVVRPLVDQSIDPVSPAPTLDGVSYPDGIADYLAQDPRVVLDRLASGDLPGGLPTEIAERLDLKQVGAFGLSLGGLTTSQWCATDQRVKACAMLDAPMSRTASQRGLDVPALWITRPAEDMRAENWPEHEVTRYAEGQHALYEANRAPAWYLTAAGRKHADLSDAPYGNQLLALAGMTSAGKDEETHDVIRFATTDFFEHTLAGRTDTGVLEDAPWEDVEVTARP